MATSDKRAMSWRTLLLAELLALALAPAARGAEPYVVAGAWGASGHATAGIAPDVPITVDDLLADADGAIMIGGANQVLRVDPRGMLTIVAGTRHTGNRGDGGPATAATLDYAGGMARAPAGALLVVSGGELRRIALDGVITTLAGGGPLEPPPLGEPIPATLATPSIRDVAVAAGGRLLVSTRDSAAPLLELPGDGTLRALPAPANADARCQSAGALAALPLGGLVFAGAEAPVVCAGWRVLIARYGPVAANLREVADVSVYPDGGLLVTDTREYEPSRLLRFAPGAARATEIPLAGDGINLPRSFTARAAVVAPDGGLLVAGDRQVVYLPPARPGRVALRFEPRPNAIGLRATLPGRLRLQIGKRTLR